MTHDSPTTPPTESPHAVPLVPRRPLWQRITDGALLAKIALSFALVWVTVQPTSCHGEPASDPYTLTGFEVFTKVFFLWFTLPPLALVIIVAFFRRLPRRTTALAAVGRSYALVVLLLAAIVSATVFVTLLIDGNVTAEIGINLALAALLAILALQLFRLVRSAVPLPAWLWRHGPWLGSDGWRLAAAVLNAIAALVGLAGAAYFIIETLPQWELPEDPFQWGIVAFFLLIVACPLLFIVSALGILARHAWAAPTQLFLTVTSTVVCIFILGERTSSGDFAAIFFDTWYNVPLMLLFVAWTFYTSILAWRRSAHRWQRRRCPACGVRRWLSAPRCPVCGERLWIHRNHDAPPVCLACGYEHPAARPVCRPCRKASPAPDVAGSPLASPDAPR